MTGRLTLMPPAFRISAVLLVTLILAPSGAVGADESASDNGSSVRAVQQQDPFPDAVAVPPDVLDAGTDWLNAPGPLTPADLKGKVVLLDFWTYCCINCMHILPDLRYLEEKYPNQLVVIGVHSAKFDNEKQTDNIRNAVMRYDIRHPVVNDGEMRIWRNFGVRAWPTVALIDPQGRFIGSQSGEGHRELLDAVIGRLVDYHRSNGTLDETPIVFPLESRSRRDSALLFPGKITSDGDKRLFIADSGHHRIIVTNTDGELLDIIGSGRPGSSNGGFAAASFQHPQGMAFRDNQLYIADTENHLLRVADLSSRTVTTIAGTGRQGRPGRIRGKAADVALNSPWDLCFRDNRLYIAMAGPHQIWQMSLDTGDLSVLAGSAREDVLNGTPQQAAFAQPSGLALSADKGSLYVVDSEGSAVRRIELNENGEAVEVSTIAGPSQLARGQSLFTFGYTDGVGGDARFQHPIGITRFRDNLLIADSYNHRIRRLNPLSGEVTSWTGTGEAGSQLAPGQLNEPSGLCVVDNQLYIADTNNHRICREDPQTRALQVLEIRGLLSPEKPAMPDWLAATFPGAAPEADATPTDIAVNAGTPLELSLEVTPPVGWKRNTDFPVTWTITRLTQDAENPLFDSALQGQTNELNSQQEALTISLPTLVTESSAEIELLVTTGYCSSGGEGLCRLAGWTWTLSLTPAESATGRGNLTFPPEAFDQAISDNSLLPDPR